MLIVVLIATVALLAYANGSNDNFKAVATLYGSGTLSYRMALVVASGAQLLGSLASVLLAGALLSAFSGKGLVGQEIVARPEYLVAVGLGAALTVLLATRLGMPISTTHGLIGGLVGAALALAPAGLAWGNLGGKYILPLLISPVIAVAGAGLIYPIARMVRLRLGIVETTCVCIGRKVIPVELTAGGGVVCRDSGVELTTDDASQCRQRYDGRIIGLSAQTIVDALHVVSGSALGFARGLNDTPKILALLVAASWSGLNPRLSLIIVAVVMCLGGLLHSARLARTLGKRITEMNHGQGFVANFVASALVIGASKFGMPVSTTHVSTGAIFGIGLWTGKADRKVVLEILAAWVLTLPIAGLLAYLAGTALTLA